MTPDQSDKTSHPQAEPEGGASSDWEEAFQAEDYLLSDDAAPQSLFEAPPGSGKQGSSGQGESGPAAPRPPGKGKAPLRRAGGFFDSLGRNRVVDSVFNRLPSAFGQGAFFRSPRRKGAFITLVAALCCIFLLVLVFRPVGFKPGIKTDRVQESTGVVDAGSPELKKEAVAPPPPSESEGAQPEKSVSSPVVPPENNEKAMADKGSTRRKWRFSSFMINASQDEAGKPSYVVVDLSLVLRLQDGEDFPEEKEYAVREMIYQFFSNRPLYELRRFAMARGEMRLKLQAWLQRQWPGNPIESILFHRYQIV